MAIQDNQMKLDFAHVWDISSATYDDREGHGIQSEIEREAWKTRFQSLLPFGRLEVLDIGCGTGEIGLLFAELGHQLLGLISRRKCLQKQEKNNPGKSMITFLK